jgi:hypothetical protein
LGAGRHPVAGNGDRGFITTYLEESDEGPAVGATLFDIWGKPQHHVVVSDGGAPIHEANPVAAELPDGSYAVAWTDLDGDGSDLGIALRKVKADGTLEGLRVANQGREFSQRDPDMLWTGSELVVSWVDFADASTGPDLRYRTFDADLKPTSGDVILAASELPEAAVALAPFNGGWAAAYRAGRADGAEDVVVKVGSSTYRIGPVFGGPIDDRPTLVELDALHLLVIFSAGTDSGASGVYNTARLRYSVVNLEGEEEPTIVALDPIDAVYVTEPQTAQTSPVAAKWSNGAYVAWRSEARPGDAAGDQLWLKYFEWRDDQEPQLKAREREMLIPRTCEGSFGDQRQPALVTVGLPPSGALAMAWDDYAHSAGTSGSPDVVVQYAPAHDRSPDDGRVFAETWTAPNGSLAAPWTSTTTGVAVVGIVGSEAKVTVTGGIGTATLWNDEINTLNIDMTVSTRWAASGSQSTLFARRSDAEPSTYVQATFGAVPNDTWRIHWVNNGVATVIASAVQHPAFTTYAPTIDYRIRFKVETFLDESVFVGAKLWEEGSPEPAAWTMQATLATTSAAARSLALRPGRFGLATNSTQAGRHVMFDDLAVKHFDDGYLGSFAHEVVEPRPLRRVEADYRACRPGQECDTLQGCCTVAGDCRAGASCVPGYGDLAGLGSNANVCVAEHCFDLVLNEGEVRVDCGGPDCRPCACTSTASPGADTYCSAACPCGTGEGDCDTTAECLWPLVCSNDNGPKYNLPQTWEACAPAHCNNRIHEPDLGESAMDCGGPCGQCVSGPANGDYWHCRVWAPCANGHGACQYNDECASGTLCGSTLTGPRFGLPAGTKACVVPHCNDNLFQAMLGETKKDCGGECGSICP